MDLVAARLSFGVAWIFTLAQVALFGIGVQAVPQGGGLAGVVLLVGFPAAPITPGFLLGCLTALLGAISAAFGSNFATRHLRSASTWELAVGSFLSGQVLADYGWAAINWIVFPPVLLALASLALTGWLRRRALAAG